MKAVIYDKVNFRFKVYIVVATCILVTVIVLGEIGVI